MSSYIKQLEDRIELLQSRLEVSEKNLEQLSKIIDDKENELDALRAKIGINKLPKKRRK
jgi:uncharacterized coiled-coil protein SlyX